MKSRLLRRSACDSGIRMEGFEKQHIFALCTMQSCDSFKIHDTSIESKLGGIKAK